MKSSGLKQFRFRNLGSFGRQRVACKVGAIVDFGRGLRRQEIVLELQQLGHAADQVAGGGIDWNAHQVIAGAVDEVAVLVGLEVAAPGVAVDAVEHRLLSTRSDGFSTTKKPSPLIAMKVPIEAGLDVALHGVGHARTGGDVAGSCFDGLSSGIRSSKLVSTRLNAVVWELAMLPDTFSSAKDCARTRHRGRESSEDTHDVFSN